MRESAIATHLEQGMKKSEVCTIFKIQRCTLDSHKKSLMYAEGDKKHRNALHDR